MTPSDRTGTAVPGCPCREKRGSPPYNPCHSEPQHHYSFNLTREESAFWPTPGVAFVPVFSKGGENKGRAARTPTPVILRQRILRPSEESQRKPALREAERGPMHFEPELWERHDLRAIIKWNPKANLTRPNPESIFRLPRKHRPRTTF